MTNVSFDDFYRLLSEWKEIVKLANPNLSIQRNTNSKIDKIIAELEKSKIDRDCNEVHDLLNSLKEIKGIEKYVGESLTTIMAVCYNK